MTTMFGDEMTGWFKVAHPWVRRWRNNPWRIIMIGRRNQRKRRK